MDDGSSATRPILVIEDDEDIRRMLEAFLRLEGFWVLGTGVAADGLRLCHERHPWVVVLDLTMPGMNGVQFRLEQLSDSDISHIPVILISAHPDLRLCATELSASACLPKPFDPYDLARALQALAGRGREQRPPGG